MFLVKDPETGRETCFTQVGSIQSRESSYAECLSQLWSVGDVTTEERLDVALRAKEHSRLLEAAESKEAVSSGASRREPSCVDPAFTPVRPVSTSGLQNGKPENCVVLSRSVCGM